jgi:uncharacterized membrane protein YjdF
MSRFARSIQLTVLGWVLFVCFAVLVAVGSREVSSAVVFGAVGVAMGTWVWLRRSLPALIVSFILGLLHTIEQLAYSVADVSDHHAGTLLADLFGLVAGLCIVAGSVLALRSRSNSPAGADTGGQVVV